MQITAAEAQNIGTFLMGCLIDEDERILLLTKPNLL